MGGACPLAWTRGDTVPAAMPSKAALTHPTPGKGRHAGARSVCVWGTLSVQGARPARLCPQLLGEAGGAHSGVLTGVHAQPLTASHTLLLSRTSTQLLTHACTLINTQSATHIQYLTHTHSETEYHTCIVCTHGITHELTLTQSITCTCSITLTRYRTHMVAHTQSISHTW